MFVSKNTSGFQAEAFAATDKHGRKTLVAVVKATFDVDTDGVCTPALEQVEMVHADTFHGAPETTAIRYETDFAPNKPRCDVLLNAVAVAPGGQQVTVLDVTLLGPGIRKVARVTGDRKWLHSVPGIQASAPAPFRTMPLAWHRSFGGADLTDDSVRKHGTQLENPIGTGYRKNADPEAIVGTALPNIERPDGQMRNWSDRPKPIGFGPCSRYAASRVRYAGTYDQKWMDEILPFLPADFDERYFNSAPEDQQLDALQPGAGFVCLNMNESGTFKARLPDFRVPVRFVHLDRVERAVIQPDTLILEPDAGRIILSGRVAVDLPKKVTTLREVHIGPENRPRDPNKRRYAKLSEAVAAMRQLRGVK